MSTLDLCFEYFQTKDVYKILNTNRYATIRESKCGHSETVNFPL